MVRVVAGVAWLHAPGCPVPPGAMPPDSGEVDPGSEPFVGGDTRLEILASWDLALGCETAASLPARLDVRLSAPGCGVVRVGEGLSLLDGEDGRYHLDADNTPGFSELSACLAASTEVDLTVWTLLGGGDSGCGTGVTVPAGLPAPDELHLVVDGLEVGEHGADAGVRVELRRRQMSSG